MIVVADTSPFVALINIERVDLLPALFVRVIVPPEVLDELGSPKRPEPVRAFANSPPDWLEVRAPAAIEPIAELQAGETAAISLARECGAELLVMDESKGRKAAIERGLRVTGTIGILETAAERGMVRLEKEFERLKTVRFWISPKLLEARLAQFHERQAKSQSDE